MKDKLTPEDLHLWRINTKDVKPLSKKKRLNRDLTPSKVEISQKIPVKKITKNPDSILPFQTFGRKELRHIRIDARLDMHGMTLDQGYQALEQFLVTAQEKGFKTVLVITGKGAVSSENTLRHQFPRWLEESHLRQIITAYHQAKQHDGGQGAFYVKMRLKLKMNKP